MTRLAVPRRSVLALLLLLLGGLAPPSAARDDEPSPGMLSIERVRRDYARALERAEALDPSLSGRAQVVTTMPNGLRIEATAEFAQDGDRQAIVHRMSKARRGDRTQVDETVIGRNTRCAFQLSRAAPDRPFRLESLSAPDDPSVERTLEARYAEFLAAPYALAGVRVSTLLADPAFLITRACELRHEGKRLIQIDFRYAGPLYPQSPMLFGAGWLRVSPEDSWSLEEWDALRFGKHPTTCSITYAARVPQHGPVLPARVVLEHTGDVAAARHVCVFERIDPGPVPRQRFSLAAYGLPEIEGRDEPDTRPRPSAALFGLSALALGAAVGLGVAARRARARALRSRPG